MYPNHTTRVRPGDKWDGLVLRLTREAMDWSRAEITAVLRRFPGGPVVKVLAPTSELAGDTLSVQLAMPGTDTAFLVLTQTYHGDISVIVPGLQPGDPPEFGPYTVATFAIEASYEGLDGVGVYSLTWNHPPAIEVTLMAGGVPGQDGVGFRLGDPIYIHPVSRLMYVRADGQYYAASWSLVDGEVQLVTENTPVTPV